MAGNRSPERDGATIYIVEDHDDMRRILAEFLTVQSGLEVLGGAATAEEALESLERDQPNLLLVDVALPGMSGLELLERVRSRWPGVRCVILSGHGQREHVERALEAGAWGYILKGNPHEVPTALHRVIEGEVFLSETIRDR